MQYTYTYDSGGTNAGTDPGAGTVNTGTDPGAGVVNLGIDPGAGTVNLGTDPEASVKIKNVTIRYYKEIRNVVAEFDARDLGWTAETSDWQIKILEGVTERSSVTETVKTNWERFSATWNADLATELQDFGDRSFTVRIIDEDGTATDTTKILIIDDDPNELFLNITSASSSTDSTPDIVWTLNDLSLEYKISPVLTVGANTANSMTVTFDDDTTQAGLSSGYVILFSKFSDSNLVMGSADAGKAYWHNKQAKNYRITAPTMSPGSNSYTLNLNLIAI